MLRLAGATLAGILATATPVMAQQAQDPVPDAEPKYKIALAPGAEVTDGGIRARAEFAYPGGFAFFDVFADKLEFENFYFEGRKGLDLGHGFSVGGQFDIGTGFEDRYKPYVGFFTGNDTWYATARLSPIDNNLDQELTTAAGYDFGPVRFDWFNDARHKNGGWYHFGKFATYVPMGENKEIFANLEYVVGDLIDNEGVRTEINSLNVYAGMLWRFEFK